MEKDASSDRRRIVFHLFLAMSVSGIDLGCDASLGSAGPVVPADEAWVVGWLVQLGRLSNSPTSWFFCSVCHRKHTHTRILCTHQQAHTHSHKRAHTQILENPKKSTVVWCTFPDIYYTHIPISSQMNPNSDFVISNSCSDVNLRSSLFSKNVNTR